MGKKLVIGIIIAVVIVGIAIGAGMNAKKFDSNHDWKVGDKVTYTVHNLSEDYTFDVEIIGEEGDSWKIKTTDNKTNPATVEENLVEKSTFYGYSMPMGKKSALSPVKYTSTWGDVELDHYSYISLDQYIDSTHKILYEEKTNAGTAAEMTIKLTDSNFFKK